MMTRYEEHKLTPERLSRKALVYLRQSTERQVVHNRESQRLQYALAERAQGLGFREVETVDDDLGKSAAAGAKPRVGFERVLAQVALGQVGLVLGREVSRLLRTDKDWCQLVEVCRLFDTLIGDEDGLYDLNTTNDQLVLGVKGTISVVELRTLQLRLRDGIAAKAARGELYQGPLAAGYVLDGTGRLVKDPNARVQLAIGRVFQKFAETWTIRQTYQWFRDARVELPIRAPRSNAHSRAVRWKVPGHEHIAGILHNPIYAGAYVYGRIQNETVWEAGRLVKRRRVKKLDGWRVLLRDHHEAYISWAEFEENARRIAKNVARKETNDSETAVRAGRAIFAGLLRCGLCGRRLGVSYTGPGHAFVQYHCQGDYKASGRRCQSIGGVLLEKQLEAQLLSVLSPLGIAASLRAQEAFDHECAEQREVLERQLEEAGYEAQRAFEQYDAVDARNRLVASELERRWNEKLAEQERLQEQLRDLHAAQQPLSDAHRQRIAALGAHFEDVWSSPHCPSELRKKIVRTVLEEVVVTRDDATATVQLILHWKGGAHTSITIPLNRRHPQATAVEALDIIRKMAEHYGDGDIARVLVQAGLRTGQGNSWDAARVASARQKNGIAGRRHTVPRAGYISMHAAVELSGASDATLLKLIKRGLIHAEQVVPRAPWLISERDLKSERVRRVLDELRRTGRLPGGDQANGQRELFE